MRTKNALYTYESILAPWFLSKKLKKHLDDLKATYVMKRKISGVKYSNVNIPESQDSLEGLNIFLLANKKIFIK